VSTAISLAIAFDSPSDCRSCPRLLSV